MCRGELKSWSLVWLVRCGALLACLQLASVASASCGHYVFTKLEWFAANAAPQVGTDPNLAPIERFCLNADQFRASPRFSAKHGGKHPERGAPCNGPGCRQLPDGWSFSSVTPDPTRLSGLQFIAVGVAILIFGEGGFDPAVTAQVEVNVFENSLFRPPRV